MSFPRYPEYKDSGVEWLGEVPVHWFVALAKRYITVKSGDMISSDDEREDGFPLIGGNGLRAYTYKSNTPANTLVIGRVGAQCGCVHHIRDEFWASEHAFRVIEKNPIGKRYFYYLLGGLNLNNFAIKTAQPLLNTEIVETQWVAVPDMKEQEVIGRFLDAETKKIDRLISEQEKLIALLKEKRQAVISHAVTKGLDSSVPMKDSGIEWLGEVPAHWDLKRLKHLAIDAGGIQMGPFGGMLVDLVNVDTGYKVYGQENTISGDFTSGSRWVSESRFRELSNYQLEVGDIVLTRKGSLGNCRRISLLPQPGIIDSDTIRVRVLDRIINPNYLEVLLHEAGYISVQLALAKRGAILSGLNTEIIANLAIVLPPCTEQETVLRKIGEASLNFDQGVCQCEHAIELLKERRSALISAAVTGKIDVRHYKGKEVA